MKVSLSANAAQSRQLRQQLASPDESLSYELGKAVQELPPLYTRILAAGICVMTLGAITWAHFSEVEEVATTSGKIIPSTEVRPVRSLTLGSISKTRFKTGDSVKKGEVLVEIDPGSTETNVASLEKDAAKIKEEISRLESENKGGITGGSVEQNQFLAARQLELQSKQAAAAAEQNKQLGAISEAKSRYDRFGENLANAKITLQNAEAAEAQSKTSQALAQKRRDMLKPLENSGAIPNQDVIRAAQEVSQATQQVITASGQVTQARDAIASLENEINAQADRVAQAQQAYESARSSAGVIAPQRTGEVLGQLTQRRTDLTKKLGEIDVAKKQQQEKETLKAPFDGTVYNVKVTQGPIQQGEELMSILPKDEPLVLEVKIRQADIGFIRAREENNGNPIPGMKAKVKLATFPYQEFGVIEGEVIQISPDAVNEKDENGRDMGPVFQAKVKMAKDRVNVKGQEVRLSPGMAGTADIVTRKKSILSSILEPITRKFSESMSVR
jgi:HlyD family secretion protein